MFYGAALVFHEAFKLIKNIENSKLHENAID